MLRKLLVLGAVAGAVCLLPSLASAQPQAGDWELTLVGSGVSSKKLNSASIAGTAGLGYFFTKNAEVAVRQGVSYQDLDHDLTQGDSTGGGTTWTGNTTVAADWHFDLDRWQPFVGVNIGMGYGDGKPTYNAGVEGGVKYYIHRHAFVFGQLAYEFDLKGKAGDGQFLYSLGIGTNW
jgi:hypothetical protein